VDDPPSKSDGLEAGNREQGPSRPLFVRNKARLPRAFWADRRGGASGLPSHPSQKARRMGHPGASGLPSHLLQNARRMGHPSASGLPSHPSQKARRMGHPSASGLRSHPSQNARRMGHPGEKFGTWMHRDRLAAGLVG
jgi:hypothetical protein